MIRFRCSQCNKALGVNDSLAGKVGTCPVCKNKVRIPAPVPEVIEEVEAIEEPEVVAPPPLPPQPSTAIEERPPPRRRRPPAPEEEDLDEEVERRPRRRRRRKKRRKRSASSSMANLDLIAKIAVPVICVLFIAVGFLVPALLAIPVLIGFLLVMAGGVWFLIIAFQDDVMHGLLCMFVPFYSLYYLVTNFDETKSAFFTQLIGIGIIMLSSCVGGPALSDRERSPRFRSERVPAINADVVCSSSIC